jgi:tRNA pseudouridine38-40 synthase
MRYLAVVSYDGTKYHGFQRQSNALGIQNVIEKALRLMTQTSIMIHSAGRTDKGVHALGQTFHFDTNINLEPQTWIKAINDRLPLDIRILKIKKVIKTFHARHNATKKTYRYVIAKKPSTAFTQNYEVYIEHFNPHLVTPLLKDLEGTHDFRGYTQYVAGKNTVRTIDKITFKETKKHYYFTFEGPSFLKYMVRSIMGTLIEVGIKKVEAEVVKTILETKDRKLAGKTAEARGLFLVKIDYK